MLNTSSYYLYQKYETRSGSTTIPVLPITLSIDGDGTMPLAVRKVDDQECGATPVQYRWVNMDVSTNYICNGYDKYYKQKKQQSTDGQTWTDVTPAEYRRGDLYETNSPDCGYITDYIFTGTCPTGSEVFTVAINNNAQVQTEKIADGKWGIRYNNRLTSLSSVITANSYVTSVVATSVINSSGVTTMNRMFSRCSGITSIDLSNLDTRNVLNLAGTFVECENLTDLDITSFNTSACTNMSGMFNACESLTFLDLTHFDTRRVTDMSYMFAMCYGLEDLDITSFNTSACTNMEGVFDACRSLESIDVSSFDTSNVTNMSYMFAMCSGLTSLYLTHFDTSKVTDMRYMFDGCKSLTNLNLSNFDTSRVTNMQLMFLGCNNLRTLDLSSFDFTNVTGYNQMFTQCYNLSTIYCSASNKSWIQARIAEAGLTQSINYIIN